MLSGVSAATPGPAPGEYQVKAVFLFNFTQFVEWPPDSFANTNAPFVIGVLGADPFGQALDDAVRGEQVNGHPLVIERYRSRADVKPCQILVIGRSTGSGSLVDAIDQKGTLTVSDSETSTRGDVVIRFVTESKKIRLRINVDSAREAGLTISSKLLRPAEVVGSGG